MRLYCPVGLKHHTERDYLNAGCVDGIIESNSGYYVDKNIRFFNIFVHLVVTIWTGVTLAARYKDSRAWVAIIYFFPNVLGSILVNALPWSDKVGLLFSVWITGVGK